MDINSVSSAYNLNSPWNNSKSTIPLVNNVDTVVKQNSTVSVPLSTPIPVNGPTPTNSTITSQYNSVVDGTSKSDISSIISSNPSILYKAVDLLGASQSQVLGNFINALL